MSINNQKILAVIPARGGSKGIPNKNLRVIQGKSLVDHAATCAKSLGRIIDAIVLSSDSEEIIEHAKTLHINAPFKRPLELSNDDAKSIDMWKHAWLVSEDYYKEQFDISILLEPTSPLRTPDDIKNTLQLLIDKQPYSVVTVSKTPGHYTPHKTLEVKESGVIQPYLEDGLKFSIRQHIPNYYHRNGICYAVTRESLIDKNNLMQENCLALIIDRPIVNIDEEIDLKLAEVLMAEQSQDVKRM